MCLYDDVDEMLLLILNLLMGVLGFCAGYGLRVDKDELHGVMQLQ